MRKVCWVVWLVAGWALPVMGQTTGPASQPAEEHGRMFHLAGFSVAGGYAFTTETRRHGEAHGGGPLGMAL